MILRLSRPQDWQYPRANLEVAVSFDSPHAAEWEPLLQAAWSAWERAYVPYSHFRVGAALQRLGGGHRRRLQCRERQLSRHPLRRTHRALRRRDPGPAARGPGGPGGGDRSRDASRPPAAPAGRSWPSSRKPCPSCWPIAPAARCSICGICCPRPSRAGTSASRGPRNYPILDGPHRISPAFRGAGWPLTAPRSRSRPRALWLPGESIVPSMSS